MISSKHRLSFAVMLFIVCAFIVIRIDVVQSQTFCGEVAGRTERNSYYADIIQTQMFYTVYLPPCYDASDDVYPLIYLLHGSDDDDNHWLRLGTTNILDAGIVSGEIPPVIVVLPFGNWAANENYFAEGSWGSIFVEQLMPLVETAYRTDNARESRAIGGISRGGFWAFHIAFRNPDLFATVGGHSAFFDAHHASPEYNPLDLALDAPGIETLRIAFDRGVDDYAAPGLDMMHDRLTERGLEHTYTIHDSGQHNNDYWMRHLGEYLRFYTEDWLPDDALAAVTQSVTADEIGWYLLLPVVDFPSLQANISSERLAAIRVGLLDDSLVLGDDVAADLALLGVPVASGTRIVPAEEVHFALSGNRTLFTLLPFDRMNPHYRVLHVDELHPLDINLGEYDFAFHSDQPNFYPERLTRFLLSGVTALTRATREALDEHDVDWAGEAIAPYVLRADFFHMSNEVSINPICPDNNRILIGGSLLSFCSKEEHFELLTNLGVDIVELSGNHNNDYGHDAYRDTLTWYRERGIATIGGGNSVEEARSPLILSYHDNQIALLSCNWAGPYYSLVNEDSQARGGIRPGAAYCDIDWLQDVLPRLASENDLVVVTVQYREYNQYTPTDRQKNEFRLLTEWGADVVIGTQAHMPQTMDFISTRDGREAFVHYGLGNLFFDQQYFGNVRFFMDQLFVYEGQLLAIDLFTGIIEGQGRPRPMTAEERENFLYMMFNTYDDW